MKKFFIASVSIILMFLSGCGKDVPKTDKEALTVATFNIAWLGDGVDDRYDRTEDNYKIIAGVIEETGADLIGLQEIENIGSVKRLLKYLPEYKGFVGEKGRSQNLGLLYKKHVQVTGISEYLPLKYKGYQRPGLIAECKMGNFDWITMVVHFKSTSRYDDTPEKKQRSYRIRTFQVNTVDSWADSILANSKEQDIIIIGDFNDTPTRKKNPTLNNMLASPSLEFLTTDLKSCKYESWYVIDHVVTSKSAKQRYLKNSARVYNFRNGVTKDVAKNISDHCPVLADFEIVTPDND